MKPTRTARLAHQLQQEIAMIIHRELKDPRLGFVTITGVELSNDIRHAKVFFSCLGDDAELSRSHDALTHSGNFIRGLIKKRLRLKIIPEIVFHFDNRIKASIDINQKLDELMKDQGE